LGKNGSKFDEAIAASNFGDEPKKRSDPRNVFQREMFQSIVIT